jgi:hypothetical protein
VSPNHVSYKFLPENTKFTQQNIIDVGDAPGHQVRIIEIHRTFPTNPPMFNGLKLVEQWSRGTSDYIDNNGSATTYGVFIMENGDKFFTRSSRRALRRESSISGRLEPSRAPPASSPECKDWCDRREAPSPRPA